MIPKKIQKIIGTSKTIDENIFHKVKSADRRRQIELQKLDNEIIDYPEMSIKGNYAIEREKKIKYKKIFWRLILLILAIPIVYITAIFIYDLY